MTALKIDQFQGIFPRLPASQLPDRAAETAEWVNFNYRELRSLREGEFLRDMGAPVRTLFSEDGLRFYTWTRDVNCVVSPLMNGPAADRVYFTDGTDFRHALRSATTTGGGEPGTSWRVGVPRPTLAPTLTALTPPPADATDIEARAYVYTYVNLYGEEGPPSDAVVVNAQPSVSVQVGITIDSMPQFAGLKEIRIYRTQNGGTSGNYYFALPLDAIGKAPGEYVINDGTPAAMLNEPLASLNYYPPNPALRGLISIGNGILAAWIGNAMYFSEAYKPWAWPPGNTVTFSYAVVGATAHGAGVLVTTLAAPAVVSGVSPDAMTQMPLNIPHAGVSKHAQCDLSGVSAYACHDGIVIVNGVSGSLAMSEKYFTREVWRARYAPHLATMQFAYYDGMLFVFSRSGAFVPFMLRMDETDGAMTDLPGFVASACVVLTTADQMYYMNGNNLYQFGSGAQRPLSWKSRELVLQAPVNFGVARVLCDGDFVLRFYADGTLRHTQPVSAGDTTFRLPSGFTAQRWQVDIAGTGRFREFRMADTGRNLATV